MSNCWKVERQNSNHCVAVQIYLFTWLYLLIFITAECFFQLCVPWHEDNFDIWKSAIWFVMNFKNVQFYMCFCIEYILYVCLGLSGTRLAVTVFRLSVACSWSTSTETSSMLWVSPSTTSANNWIWFTTSALSHRTRKFCLSPRDKMAPTPTQ